PAPSLTPHPAGPAPGTRASRAWRSEAPPTPPVTFDVAPSPAAQEIRSSVARGRYGQFCIAYQSYGHQAPGKPRQWDVLMQRNGSAGGWLGHVPDALPPRPEPAPNAPREPLRNPRRAYHNPQHRRGS